MHPPLGNPEGDVAHLRLLHQAAPDSPYGRDGGVGQAFGHLRVSRGPIGRRGRWTDEHAPHPVAVRHRLDELRIVAQRTLDLALVQPGQFGDILGTEQAELADDFEDVAAQLERAAGIAHGAAPSRRSMAAPSSTAALNSPIILCSAAGSLSAR